VGDSFNGTPCLLLQGTHGVNDVLAISRLSGASFGLISIDISETFGSLSGVVPAISVAFNGFKTDGSMVTTTFVTDGFCDGRGGEPDFQTFIFDSSFATGLMRVETPSSVWALDNIVFVPEPGVWSLLGLGALGLAVWRRRGK